MDLCLSFETSVSSLTQFNLDVDESIGLSKILEPWRHDVLQPIVFEVTPQADALSCTSA